MNLQGHIRRQRKFSRKTFGPNFRKQGIIDHIRKELRELEVAIGKSEELKEWVDIIILALDGAWRTSATAGEICAAIKAKQAINEEREWPDWRTQDTAKAIEHIRDNDEAVRRQEREDRKAREEGV